MSDLKPLERIEFYLDAIAEKLAGNEPEVPEPQTREEYFLKKIVDNASSGGGGGGGFINPLIHLNISFENDVTECNMIWQPEPTIVFTTAFAFLVDSENKLLTASQLEIFFDSERPFEWGISLISPHYQEGNSIWLLAITASSETQEIKSVTSSDCQAMLNASTFACAIPNGQSEATVNVVIGNIPK